MAESDDALVRAFEGLTLRAADFNHAAHVRVAWWYLQHGTLGEALDRFSRGLTAFAASHGAAGKYHETTTVAWLLLIAERLEDARGLEWAEFAARYPELFAREPGLLAAYYSKDTLSSVRARRSFLMPDRRRSPDEA